MRTEYVLEERKLGRLLFAAGFLVYMSSYVGRTNFSAALAAMVAESVLTKSQGGLIGSVFFFAYGACQVLWGFVGDRVSPFRMIGAGMLMASCANLVMPFCTGSYALMAVVWGINGISQSMLWSPILRIFSGVLPKSMRAKACLNISASIPAGTILTYLLATAVIRYSDWRYVFTFAGVVLALVLVFFAAVYMKIRPALHIQKVSLSTRAGDDAHASSVKLLPLFVTSGLIFATVPTVLHGALKEGITVWVPTMLSECYPLSTSFSVFLTLALPLINLTGVYIITPVYKRLMKKNELSTAAVCLLFSVPLLLLLTFMSKLPAVVSVILMGSVTTAMHAYNYMLITLVPVRFSSLGKTASVTGILNACAYAGCALSSYGFGAVAENTSWRITVFLWLIIAASGGVICLILSKKWRSFCNERI